MAQTYAKLQKQIEVLQRQAEAIRLSEVQGVVDRIKVAIAHYDLTPEHLFGTARIGQKKKLNGKSQKVDNDAKYADGAGNVWGGRGPRPRWLRNAIGSGASLEDFRAKPAGGSPDDSALAQPRLRTSKASASKRPKRAPSAVRYADDAGNTWTGRGPRPRWLKTAVAEGKELSDFLK